MSMADKIFRQSDTVPDLWTIREEVFKQNRVTISCLGILIIGEYPATTEARIYRPDGTMRSYKVWSVEDYPADTADRDIDTDEVSKVYLFLDFKYADLRKIFKQMFDIDAATDNELGSYKQIHNLPDVVMYAWRLMPGGYGISLLKERIHDISTDLDLPSKQPPVTLTEAQVSERLGYPVKVIPG